jgi:DMSO/TMAO reductase YedYZ molybdopterin-dependent catalytic subunit
MKRRDFIKITAVAAAGTMLPFRYLDTNGEAAVENIGTQYLRPASLITPNDEFYVLQIGDPPNVEQFGKPPEVANWRLAITGLVERPTMITYPELTSMEAVTTVRTLKCIGDPIGVEQMSNAEWTGARLRDALQKAGVKASAKVVVFRCADGYHTAVPIEQALREDVLLAYKMNGQTLPREHGFPVRLLNPGRYGTKNPKWIMNIVLAEAHVGYWEMRGWDPVARVKLATLIGTPGQDDGIEGGTTCTISGAAFDAGNHGGVKRVEVSVDGGKTWNEAEIWASDSPLTWYLWKYEWKAPETSQMVEIYARAVANDGLTQKASGVDVEPVGAVGYHTVRVEVIGS